LQLALGLFVPGKLLARLEEKRRRSRSGFVLQGGNAANHMRGRVTDASFTGVATQYLVRMPWGRDLMVVQQNDGSARAGVGENVTLSWDPGREFVLDAAQDDHAGIDGEDADG